MATKYTREGALKSLAKSGIPLASPDDPIYKRAPSTIFVRQRGEPTKKTSPSSESTPQTDPTPGSVNPNESDSNDN